MSGAFAAACGAYASAGWPCVIPVPAEAKFPPPEGFTGAGGADTTPEQLAAWSASRGGQSVALRMPGNLIGIDVDDYVKRGVTKRGGAALAEYEARWGPLPATWSSTARGPGPSRILFFRAPPGRYATKLGDSIDIIQRHHRYSVVAPSVNPETGTAYLWYAPDGTPAERFVPAPGQMAELPAAWVAGLAGGAAEAGPAAADRDSGRALLDILLADRTMPCAEMDAAARAAYDELSGALPGSRHDVMTEHAYHVVQLGAEGHPGCGWILTDWLEARWDELTAGENREGEFANMILSAARKAVTAHGADRPGRDPCVTSQAIGWGSPSLAGTGMVPPDMLAPLAAWSPREAWGAHTFITQAQLDSLLARDVLARTWPGLRYAAEGDSGAWIVRGPLKWEARGADMARWAVDEMFWLMPRGNSDAPDGSDDKADADRRKRFGTAASAGQIAAKMAAQVSGGSHPCSVNMADLDGDADILWAGGIAWDLRASGQYPVIATRVDPGTPHLHTAACVPEIRPTPLFGAFARAVWPDEEMRRWALRVLSVAFTGYPDKSLPILLGATDRGKTEIIKMLMSVLGSYALKSADARLLSAADRSHASIVYALKGCRLAFIDEAPRTGHLAQERLKALTGGAPLTGNRMRENPVTFSPTHTLVLTANPDSEPVLTDPAVRRRVRLLACDGDPEQIRAARAAIGMLTHEAWRAEAPGVLALMMAHAAAWIADPLSSDTSAAPASVRRAAEEIAVSQDVIGMWAADAAEPHEAGTRAHALYENFVAWCKNSALPQIPSETRWGRRLNELGFPPKKRADANYRPLRIRTALGTWHNPGSMPSTASAPETVGGSSALVPGPVNSPGETVHPQNPSSDSAELYVMDGMDGMHTHYTHTTSDTYSKAHTPAPPHIYNSGNQVPTTIHSPLSAGQEGYGLTQPPNAPIQPVIAPAFTFDLETCDAAELFTRERGTFVRLAGIIGAAGKPAIVDVPDLLALLGVAGEIRGHNILGFDLLALAYHHGADWEQLAARARDTELIARQADPPRSRETHSADSYDLDTVAERLGLGGKTDSLARLKRKFRGYDKIPADDPEYRSYLEGDLRASAAVAERLGNDAYTAREHALAALAGRMTLNGFAVDTGLLEQRLSAGQARKREALELLADAWGLPLARTVLRGRGKDRHEESEILDSPLSSDSGRAWLAGIWDRYGVADPPRTGKTGKLATGADDLKAVAERPGCPGDLKAVLSLMTVVTGTRTVYQTAADCLCPDGRVHPTVSMRQASGRWSVTNPGLTVFGKRGGRHVERDIFLPDPGHVLLSFDLSQVDMRGIAGLCQDPAYMALFEPGRDAHAEIAAQLGISRHEAKARGHGWNYGLGGARMIREGADPDVVRAFISGMEARFPVLIAWREAIREHAKAGGILDNGFGRRMRADPARAYTVAPALMGQGSARDIMCESLLRLPRETYPMLRVMVHDEIVMSVPKDIAADVARAVKAAFTWEWRGVPILCDMSGGRNWGEASAK